MTKIGSQLAQINIAKMKGSNIDDPIMQEFVENLDVINQIAEKSDGFIWRLKDESNNATGLNPYDDEQIIINVSVWENLKSLQDFMYKTHHSHFMKNRGNWFTKLNTPTTALWWIKSGEFPSINEAAKKLNDLQINGSSDEVFDFKYLSNNSTKYQ